MIITRIPAEDYGWTGNAPLSFVLARITDTEPEGSK